MTDAYANTRKVVTFGLAALQILVATEISGPLKPRTAAAESTGVLVQAQEAYGAAHFDEAVQLIRTGIEKEELRGQDLALGLETMACCFVRLGRPADADTTFYRLLDQDSTWKVDSGRLQDDELNAFAKAKERWLSDHAAPPPEAGKKPLWRKTWVWIVGAPVVAGVAYLLFHKTSPDKPTPLPGPPPPPN